MKKTNKTFKVFLVLFAVSGVAVAVDYQEQNTPKNEVIVGNDLGSFKPPPASDSFLDKIKNYLRKV